MPSTEPLEILVASDQQSTRDYLQTLLQGAGHGVLTAESFHQARERMLHHPPQLLIADVRLGDYNGLHLGWIRHFADPGLPTIITHVLFDPTLEAEARKLGAPFIVLPVMKNRLLNLAEDLISPAPVGHHVRSLASPYEMAVKRRDSEYFRIRH
jgi:DNA-binding NtrC family response regulator